MGLGVTPIITWATTPPGGQQDQGHGVVLHDYGEVYQQPIFFKSRSSNYEC